MSTKPSATIDANESEDSSESTEASEGLRHNAKKSFTHEEIEIRKALINRSYHLPGNSYWQDLYQYLTNNHPLIGIFIYHPLHPVRIGMRFVAFFGSTIFGLMMTNIIYMAFVLEDQQFDKSLVHLTLTDQEVTGNVDIDNTITQFNVTNGMIALWTVGAALNALYDNLIWSAAACTCCLEGGRFEHLQRYRNLMPLVIMFVVVGTAAAASLVVLIVSTIRSNEQDEQTAKLFGIPYDSSAHSYKFLLSYSVELLLSLLVWYPLMGALLFSGVLGCGRLPVLGGRPFEVRALEERKTADEPIEQGQEVVLSGSGKVNLDEAV